MVTSPVMEIEITNLTPARSFPRILTGTLQAQLTVYVTPQGKNSQYFEYNQTRKQTTKITPLQQ